jgi:hypothetical protein
MIDLHRQAFFNYYAVLDTISWDTVFNAPEKLDATWRFLSTSADGLLYISDFTRQRIPMRFPSAPGVREFTMHLSFHPDDYMNPAMQEPTPQQPYLLVIGNQYDHKNLIHTIDLLSTCFPLQPIKTIGLSQTSYPLVETPPTGNIPEIEIDRLYAHARLIVFPS